MMIIRDYYPPILNDNNDLIVEVPVGNLEQLARALTAETIVKAGQVMYKFRQNRSFFCFFFSG